MKRVGNLYPKITDFSNLYMAFKKAFRGTNRSRDTLRFYFDMENELLRLQDELKSGTYKPSSYRYFKIYDPKERIISVAPFRDRVVHHAIVNVLEPIYEKAFIYDSYATRKSKGTHKAILRAQSFLKKNKWFLKADVQKYFETIYHNLLMEILSRKIKDRDILNLLGSIIENGGCEGKGLPIGNLTSQVLANVYLNPFDHYVKSELKMMYYIRYMDDFVIFSDNKDALKFLRKDIEFFLERELQLRLKPKALILNQRLNGLSFLGARIFPNLLRIKKDSLKRCMSKLHNRLRMWESGHLTEDTFKMSLSSIAGHMSFFNTSSLRRNIEWGKH